MSTVNVNGTNNEVNAINANQSIIVTDNNTQNSVNVTQPVTTVVEVAIPGIVGPPGPSGSIGPSGSSAPFTELGNGIWQTTSSIQLTGSLDITGSLTVNTINVGQNTINFIDSNNDILTSLSFLTDNLILSTGSILIPQGGVSGSLYGTSSWATNYNETDPVFTSKSGSFTTTSSFNSFTSSYYLDSASFNTRINNIVFDTSSLVTTSSFNSFTSSIQGQVTSLTNATSSYVTNSQTSSFVTNNQTSSFVQNSQTSSMLAPYVLNSSTSSFVQNSQTGSFATTGSNTFIASQVITGSLTITNDLIVLGSSSINYISQSTLNIGTNLITVNTNTPSVRFGGLAVIDSGSSPQTSGSILFDSQNDQWIFVHRNTGGQVTSSVFIQGPQTFNNLGNETTLTTNRLTKAYPGDLGEHIGDSNITDTGTVVSINSDTEITGSLRFLNGGVTGSLFGTASWAENYNETDPVFTAKSGSFTTTSSFNSFTSSYNTGSFTGSFTGELIGTASYATTASFALTSTGISETLAIAYAVALG